MLGVLVLALAAIAVVVGGYAAVSFLLSRVVTQPLPFKEPDRLVLLGESEDAEGDPLALRPISLADIEILAAGATCFQGVAGFRLVQESFGNEKAVHLPVREVTANFLKLLGVKPMYGRDFDPGESEHGLRVAILDKRLANKLADASIIGRDIEISDQQHTVLGVLPDHFELFAPGIAAWVTLVPQTSSMRPERKLIGLARLTPDVKKDQARDELAILDQRLRQNRPGADGDYTIEIRELPARIARKRLLKLLSKR